MCRRRRATGWPPRWRDRRNTPEGPASRFHHLGKPRFDVGRRCRPTTHEENRVIAGNRARNLGEPGSIDPLGHALRLAPVGANDDERVHPLDAADERGERPPQLIARRRRGSIGSRSHVGAVAGSLHEPQLLEIARDRGLRGADAPNLQLPPQLLLRGDGLAVDDVENLRLSPGLHNYAYNVNDYTGTGECLSRVLTNCMGLLGAAY